MTCGGGLPSALALGDSGAGIKRPQRKKPQVSTSKASKNSSCSIKVGIKRSESVFLLFKPQDCFLNFSRLKPTGCRRCPEMTPTNSPDLSFLHNFSCECVLFDSDLAALAPTDWTRQKPPSTKGYWHETPQGAPLA